jgi:hypothetical protein
MKKHIKIPLTLLCMFFASAMNAQVTVGTLELPADGALLQLKNIPEATPEAANANKGLLLPRVLLNDYRTLCPAVCDNYDDRKNHTGLIVYNLTDYKDGNLIPGLMVWNGTEWNNIVNKEMTENTGSEIKKKLYSATQPDETKSVLFFNSIEFSMDKGSQSYYGYPEFKVPDASPENPVFYQYHFTQYTPTYKNNVKQETITDSSYKPFMASDYISTTERNEAWMYDEATNSIYHVLFFIMGENTAAATKIYAIMVERF